MNLLLPPTRQNYLLWVKTACCFAILAVCGCSSEDPIRRYKVPKQPSAGSSEAEPREMLAAIVPQDTPWTLKFTAQPEKVEQYRQDFRQLVESLSFGPDGKPTWQLPEQWSEEAGANEFVYRAFKPSADSQVRVTLSQLSFPFDPKQLDQKRWQDYVAQNVNRWRGQLQLDNQRWEEMAGEFEPIERLSKPDVPAYYVTLRGHAGSGSMGMGGMGGPFSGGAAMPPPSMPTPSQKASPASTAKETLKVKLPEGWQEVPPLNTMAMRSYEVAGADGKKAAITFIAAGGDRESNVARWNGQVRGDPGQVAQALQQCEKLTVNGAPTEVYQLVGSGDDPQAISVAKVDWSSQDSLFIKMMGPAEVVKAQHAALVSMVQELTW